MKKIILTLLTFMTLNVSSQNMTPVTRADVNEINLKLEKVEKFGKQQRLGNKVAVIGLLTTATGVGLIYNECGIRNYISNGNGGYYGGYGVTKLANINRGEKIMLVGLGLTTVGVTIKLNSYKHLNFKPRKRISITLK